MKRLIASSLATIAVLGLVAAAPALAQAAKKTELVELDGKSVDRMQLRHALDATWVVDNQNILYRDTSRDYYLVTLKQACRQLEIRRSFVFFPAVSWELNENRTYEVRPEAGPHCGVAKIAQVDDAKAGALRDTSLRRAW